LLSHAVRRLLAGGFVDSVVVAAPSTALALAREQLAGLGDRVCVIAGGGQRTDSVRLALAAALRNAAERRAAVEVVLVHDAARAFVPSGLVKAVVAAVNDGAPAVVPVLAVTDTVKQVDEHGRILSTVDRSRLRAVQTPQGFRPDVLARAYEQAGRDATDDAGLVERLGERVHTVPGDPLAFKVTTPFDLLVAEAVARR
jgi:2-C-methyl-D-erythritol 4-phosphate cytidylyltransferase